MEQKLFMNDFYNLFYIQNIVIFYFYFYNII